MKRLRDDLRTLDPRSTFALLLAAVVLVIVQFRGKVTFWMGTELLQTRYPVLLERELAAQVAWALTTFTCFGVIPFLGGTLVLRMRPRELGFNARGFLRHLWVYAGFYLLMLPLILWASRRGDFQATYPFPRLARTDVEAFRIWEVAYFLQFCALEAFFRGFLVFTLERRFGFGAVFVMTVPYTMLHFGKPMPEAFGAIFAGVILGYMALRTRSFYGGILLHYAVALTMDLLGRSGA